MMSPPTVVTRKSVVNLLAANLGTVAIAIVFQWPLILMLWTFFAQNLVIGYFSRRRILALNEFCTEGFEINNMPVHPTPETQRRTANFFAMHFGFFHLGYFVFLFSASSSVAPLDWVLIAVTAAAFVWNHRESYQQHIEADSLGRPNIGTLMFLPYLRVVPMHIIIIAGLGASMPDALAILLFGALKTIADVGMHYAEHRTLARAAK